MGGMEIVKKPDQLYKFKRIREEEDLKRIEKQILESNVFFSKPSELNDPFESLTYKIQLHVTGVGYINSCGYERSEVTTARDKFRVFSLTDNIHSPLMWAHYANEYCGCCLIYRSDNTLSSVKKVHYTKKEKIVNEDEFPNGDIDRVLFKSLFYKMSDWSYESEWRIVNKQDNALVQLNPNELIGVVVGHNLPLSTRMGINQLCLERELPCLCTRIMQYKSEIMFFPMGMKEPDVEFENVIQETKDKYPYCNELFQYLNSKLIEEL